MKVKVMAIGIGAAGNKAAIYLMNNGILNKEDVVLVNSTLKDIPEEYRKSAIQLSLNQPGCGKERHIAKKITYDAISNGILDLDNLVRVEYNKCILLTSTEGGTGSGATEIIAKYLLDDIGINTEIIAFSGFENDVRGISNTVEFFQAIVPETIVQVISNKLFMKEAEGNFIKAEQLANREMARRVSIMAGQTIYASSQNIDDADLFKVVNTPGYCTVEHVEFSDRLKSVDQFNTLVKDMIDNTKSLEPTATCQRLAVILNLRDGDENFIDYSWSVLKKRMGNPYEIFYHIQNDTNAPTSITAIATGMKIPLDEIKAIYERYKAETSMVNKEIDTFFSDVKGFATNNIDDNFNMFGRERKKKPTQQPKEEPKLKKDTNIIDKY